MKKVNNLNRVPRGFRAFTVTSLQGIMIVFRPDLDHGDVRPFACKTGFYFFSSMTDVDNALSDYSIINNGELPQ